MIIKLSREAFNCQDYMKLYFPKSHYDKSQRGLVFPLLKPFIKDLDFTDAQRMAMYGVSEKDFEFTQLLEDADLVILTMAWSYYVDNGTLSLATNFVRECAVLNKKVVCVNAGDFGVRIPFFKNLIVLRSSGYKSMFTENEYAMPAFIQDPYSKYFHTEKMVLREYAEKPSVGFCGQASLSSSKAAKDVLHSAMRNFMFYTGFTKDQPQDIFPTSYLRASVLERLEKSDLVDTNFIWRENYRAGVSNGKDKDPTSFEFYENLKSTDYMVCVRGAGNFSVRFYEALAMGRIPIFVNSDSALPFDNFIDWKKHVVWIDYKDRKRIAERVNDFHKRLSPEEFKNLQLENRKLWEEKLRLGQFFKDFFESLFPPYN